MYKKIFRGISSALILCMIFGSISFAETDVDTEELYAPYETIADLNDGLLIEGQEISDEKEYLETWEEQNENKTFESEVKSYSLLSSILDSNGQYNGYDVYTVEDAAKYCIDLMKDHVTSISGKFIVAAEYSVSELGSGSPYTYAYNAFSDAFSDSFNESLFVDGKGGDYLLYSMYGKPFYISTSCKYFTSGDTGIALVYASPSTAVYYTSESQEQEFVKQAEQAVSYIKSNYGNSPYEKVCGVYDYICDHVEYDYDNLGTSNYYTMYTAYGALCDGKAVCQGYANLFYYLCNELGVPCRIVAGTGYTGSASGPHAWNIVQLDGTWYHVDVTWGDSYSSWYKGRYFFLQSEQNFVKGHNGTSHVMDYMTGIQYIDYTSDEFLSAYPISQVNDYCQHDYSLSKSMAASCGVYGYDVYVCSICGETYEDTIQALSHSYEITKEATCEDEGEKICSKCGDVVKIAALGHDYKVDSVVEPGCVTDGYTVYKCSRCGHTHKEDIVPSLGGHSYELVDQVSMSHEQDGYDEFFCSVCGDDYKDIYLKVEDHVFDDFSTEKTDTCGYDIETVCSICGEKVTLLSDLHVLESYIYEGKDCQKCKYCGIVIDENGEIITNIETAHDCNEHTEETIQAIEASCLNQGHTDITRCTVCGKILNDDAEFSEPTGHTSVSYSTEATCTENGHIGFEYCSVCHELLKQGVFKEATGHSLVTEYGYEPDCIEDGLTDKVYCSICGEVEESAEVIPALGHSVITIDAQEATCTESGHTEGEFCEVCGEVFEESVTIPANGHSWETVDKGINATCFTDGQKALIVCSVCGEVDPEYDGSVITAGHNLTHIEYKAPTEFEDGNIECWYCYDCDEFFLDENGTEQVDFEDTVLVWNNSEEIDNATDSEDSEDSDKSAEKSEEDSDDTSDLNLESNDSEANSGSNDYDLNLTSSSDDSDESDSAIDEDSSKDEYDADGTKTGDEPWVAVFSVTATMALVVLILTSKKYYKAYKKGDK